MVVIDAWAMTQLYISLHDKIQISVWDLYKHWRWMLLRFNQGSIYLWKEKIDNLRLCFQSKSDSSSAFVCSFFSTLRIQLQYILVKWACLTCRRQSACPCGGLRRCPTAWGTRWRHPPHLWNALIPARKHVHHHSLISSRCQKITSSRT